MKTQALPSLIEEVSSELEAERRAKEEEERRILEEKAERQKRYTESLESSLGKIIPNILDLLAKEEKFLEILGNQKYFHAIEKSSIAASVKHSFRNMNVQPLFKSLRSKMTKEQLKKLEEDSISAKKEERKYKRSHRQLFALFAKLLEGKENPLTRNEPSGGWGIKLASFTRPERRVGRMNGKEFDAQTYYHVVLVLLRERFAVQVFKPYWEFCGGGEYWGDPLSFNSIPIGLVEHIHALGSGEKEMVKTIMGKRVELVYMRY